MRLNITSVVVDTSTTPPIVLSEPNWEPIDARLAADLAVNIPAATCVEPCIVVDR